MPTEETTKKKEEEQRKQRKRLYLLYQNKGKKRPEDKGNELKTILKQLSCTQIFK